MAKVLLSDQIGSPTPVWTVNPHLSRQDNGNSGVDNPAFYDSESGLCSREDAYPKKPVAWTGDETHCSKRQCGGRLVLLMVAVCLLLAVLMAMVTAVIYLAVGEVRTTWQDEAEFQDMEEGISLVEGHLRITNRVFTKDLLQSHSEAFRKLAFSDHTQ
ncbi:vitellogenin receptor [Caerostris extrusa]|uniref:Vitellogenin receptor n=1 Tax=Caerostris extrusa TaxID=172846 RepID=A0AAV4N0V2_CAEEX|nr:vitellogenin receptor [Caerostris extrusa]